MSRTDTVIRVAAGVTVVGLAGIAGAISYSHMVELAHDHGEGGWRGHMFPLSVDGIEIVASLVLLADRRAGRPSGKLPWAALIAGTAASLAANVAVGAVDWIGRAVSGWPAFAFLVAVKLLFGLFDYRPAVAAAPRTWKHDSQVESGTVPARLVRAEVSADEASHQSGVAESDSKPQVALSNALDISGLLPAGRAARAALARHGRAITRETLARELRASGQPASNAKVSALMKALASEDHAA